MDSRPPTTLHARTHAPWDVVEELRVVVRRAEDDRAVGQRHLEAAADVLEEAVDVRRRLHAHAWGRCGLVNEKYKWKRKRSSCYHTESSNKPNPRCDAPAMSPPMVRSSSSGSTGTVHPSGVSAAVSWPIVTSGSTRT